MNTNPPLYGPLLLATQIELVTSTTVAGTLYGIAFVLYCLYLHASFPLLYSGGRKKQEQVMIACSTTIMLCALCFLVLNAWVVQDAYIKHLNFPGGPLIYENTIYKTEPVVAVGLVCQAVVDILTVAIQIWRLWVVWSGTRYARFVVILPLLCLLGFIALRVRMIVVDVTITSAEVIQDTSPDTAELALRGTAIILPTIFISGFLTFESRRQSKLIGKSPVSNLYLNVVAMLVESYALDSAWTIVFVILYSNGHPVAQFFNDTLIYIEIIAYHLILYRLGVATRRAHGSRSTHGPQVGQENTVSSVRWYHPDTQSCVCGETNMDVYLEPERDILQRRGLPV